MSKLFCYKNKLWKVINHFTGGINEFTLQPGKYLLACHGARGHNGTTSDGYGSQAYGVLTLDEEQTLYAYVGGNGTASEAGFNGGGTRAGGASDIRLVRDESDLPEGWYTTNWIANPTGYEWIKTNIDATGDIRFSIHFKSKRHSSDSAIFGAISGTSTTSKIYKLSRQRVGSSTYGYRDGFLGYYQRETDYSGYHNIGMTTDEEEFQINYLDNKLSVFKITYVDDKPTSTLISEESITPQDFSVNTKFAIFGQLNGTSISGRYQTIYLYNLKFYRYDSDSDEDVLIANFVPCVRPDQSEAGLYETVESLFYGNQAQTSTRRFSYDEESLQKVEQSMRSLSSRIIVAGGAGSRSPYSISIPSRWRDVEYVFSTPPAKPEDDDPDPPIIRESQYQEYLAGGHLQEILFHDAYAKWTYNMSPSSNNGGGVITMPFTDYSDVTYVGQDVGYSFGIGKERDNPYSAQSGGGGWFGGYGGMGGSSYVFTSTSYRPSFLEYDIDPKFQLTDTSLPGSCVEEPGVYVMVESDHVYENDVIVFQCFGETQSIELPPGDYFLKCWGGGPGGGYSEGRLTIDEPIKTFVNVGGASSALFGEIHDIIDDYHDYDNEDYSYALDYTLTANPTVGFNGGRFPKNNNHGIISAGATDIRINNNNLNSRIIVAGGAGTDETSGGGASGLPTPYGGTETESPLTPDEDVRGSFGYGGDSNKAVLDEYAHVITVMDEDLDESNRPLDYEKGCRTLSHDFFMRKYVIYGYGGGGGWFGGAGYSQKQWAGHEKHEGYKHDTKTESYGGSGYVFNEDAYVPPGYSLTPKFYLTDAITTAGGNTLGPVSKVEITVYDTYGEPNKILCHDSQGFKYFDQENQTWSLLQNQSTPTKNDFESYGSLVFTSDSGLQDEYSVILYDELDTTSFCSFYVVPNKLTISKIVHTVMAMTDYSMDSDILHTTDVSLKAVRTGAGDNAKIQLTITADINEPSSEDSKIYAINIFSDKKPIGMDKYIPDKEPTGLPLSLLPVSFGDRTPMRYKSYLCGPFQDETLVEPITNRTCCEYNREIFTAVQVKDSTRNRVRVVRLNLVENKSYIVCDLDIQSLPNYNSNNQNINSILVDEKWLYLNFFNGHGFYRILRSDTSIIYYHNHYNGKVDNTTIYGYSSTPMRWFTDNRHIIFIFSNKIVYFDTLKKKFDKMISNSNIGNADYEFEIGNQLIVRTYSQSSKTYVAAYNYITDTVITRIQLNNSYAAVMCYNDGKLYVSQSGYLYIYNETAEGLVQDGDPIITPYSSSTPSGIVGKLPREPNTMTYVNGSIFITTKDNSTLYIYDVNKQNFISVGLRYASPNGYSATALTRPTSFGKYFFLPMAQSLLMMTKDHDIKYNVGFKYTNYLIKTNKESEPQFEYDNRFVSFEDAHMSIHCGNITKEMIPFEDGSLIKKATINKEEYKQMISLKTYETNPDL